MNVFSGLNELVNGAIVNFTGKATSRRRKRLNFHRMAFRPSPQRIRHQLQSIIQLFSMRIFPCEQLAKFGTLVIGSALSCLPLILSAIRSTDTCSETAKVV